MVRTPSRRSAEMRSASTVGGRRERARELAVAALDLVVLLAGDARVAAALQREPAVVDLDADLRRAPGRAVRR